MFQSRYPGATSWVLVQISFFLASFLAATFWPDGAAALTILTIKSLFQPLVSTRTFLWSQPVKSHHQKRTFGIVSISLLTLQMLWAVNPHTSPPRGSDRLFSGAELWPRAWRCWFSAFLASASVSTDVSSANNKLLITFPSAPDELRLANISC